MSLYNLSNYSFYSSTSSVNKKDGQTEANDTAESILNMSSASILRREGSIRTNATIKESAQTDDTLVGEHTENPTNIAFDNSAVAEEGRSDLMTVTQSLIHAPVADYGATSPLLKQSDAVDVIQQASSNSSPPADSLYRQIILYSSVGSGFMLFLLVLYLLVDHFFTYW